MISIIPAFATLILLCSRPHAAGASTSTPIGDYIAQGLGAGKDVSTGTPASSTLTASPPFTNSSSSLSSTSSPASSYRGTAISGALGGAGLAYAESCLKASSTYLSSQAKYYSAEESALGTLPTGTSTETSTVTESQYGAVTCSGVTSVTTLCDEHPRVVGRASCWTNYTVYSATPIFTEPLVPSIPTYSVASPSCTVNSADCQALYSRNSSLVWYNETESYALCAFTPAGEATYSTNSAGGACFDCNIGASAARLLYWPVRTVSALGSDDLCNTKPVKVIGGTPTGTGPNTFVTEGITITSPSVGISLGGIYRLDGCGRTIASTVIAVAADDMTSVRGARALFTWEPFAYQDLNYRCQAANSSHYIVQDEPGDDCYQEVPAIAYFGDRMAFDDYNEDLPSALFTSFTIGNNYQPQMGVPLGYSTWANKWYNTTGCMIAEPDGLWDPPKALIPWSSEAGVSVPVQTTAHTSPVSSSAVPAESAVIHASQTSTAEKAGPSTATQVHPSSTGQSSRSDGPSSTEPSPSAESTPSVSSTVASTSSEDPSGTAAPPTDPVTTSSSSTDPTGNIPGLASSIGAQQASTSQTSTSADPAGQLAGFASSIGSEEQDTASTGTATTPSVTPVGTVYDLSSVTYTKLTSESSYVVVANGQTTTSIAADDPALSATGHAVFSIGSQTYTEISSDPSYTVLANADGATTIAAVDPASTEGRGVSAQSFSSVPASSGDHVVQPGSSTLPQSVSSDPHASSARSTSTQAGTSKDLGPSAIKPASVSSTESGTTTSSAEGDADGARSRTIVLIAVAVICSIVMR